jgi:DNA-binding CsgD family transcriptional regulator
LDRIRGREAELDAINDFLASLGRGPSALLLEGSAGIGKTTLWQAAIASAQSLGCRLLSSRAAESEARLAFGNLGDLFDFELPDLPAPQKRALEAALLRAEAQVTPDQHAVSLASLAVLRVLAESGPVVIAIDDIQWMDRSSARVLSFVVRRLEDEPIGLLATLRVDDRGDPVGLAGASPPLDLSRLSIGSLAESEMMRLVMDRTGDSLRRPTLARLHKVSQGNPFYALEIARALQERELRSVTGELPPIPRDLQDLLQKRLAALPDEATDVLLVAAAAARPTEKLVIAAAASPERAPTGLDVAEKADVILIEGDEVSFTHPLLASTVYNTVPGRARREVHRRLASIVDDIEERARHMALITEEPDEAVSGILEEAATHARARGAPDAAAELVDWACSLTPGSQPEARLRRTLQAAEHHFDAGDATKATAVLEEAAKSSKPGRDRARLLYRLGSISWMDLERVQTLAEEALEEAEDEPELVTGNHEHLAWVGIYSGDLSSGTSHARSSFETVQKTEELAIKSDSTSTFGMLEFLGGRPCEAFMDEAMRLEDQATEQNPGAQRTVYTAARTCNGLRLLWAGQLDDARNVLQRELSDYETAGRYTVQSEILSYLAEIESRAGDWELAEAYAREAVEIDNETGHESGRGEMLSSRALILALKGNVDEARRDIEEGIGLCVANNDDLYTNFHRAVLGLLELSLSNPAAAIGPLEESVAFLDRMGSDEPGIIPSLPNAVDALVSLGRLQEAESLTDRLEARAKKRERIWAIATAARCRAQIAAARGDDTTAASAFTEALALHQEDPQPFEIGRTFLAKGDAERRSKQKRAARESLGKAIEIFDNLGARIWKAKAVESLDRVGSRRAAVGELTPTEARIAGLVSEGKRNREIAEELFISVKTVEANLSRIFQKVGVRSRTELARRLGSHSEKNSSPRSSPRTTTSS